MEWNIMGIVKSMFTFVKKEKKAEPAPENFSSLLSELNEHTPLKAEAEEASPVVDAVEAAEKLLTPVIKTVELTTDETVESFLAQLGKPEEAPAKGVAQAPLPVSKDRKTGTNGAATSPEASAGKAPPEEKKPGTEEAAKKSENATETRGEMLSRLFEQAEEEKDTPIRRLIASLPVITTEELVHDLAVVKGLMNEQRHTEKTGKKQQRSVKITL